MSKAQKIRSRIKSVTGTRKITKAMEMIASSKIRKAQARIHEARAFIDSVEEVISDIACYSGVISEPLLDIYEDENKVLILGITADRGLCGGYNSNIIRLIEKTYKEYEREGKEVTLDIIGTRGRNYFRYMGYEISRVYENLSDHPKFLDAREISRDLISRYVSGEVHRVIICYTRFKNPAEQITTRLQLFPITVRELFTINEQDEVEMVQIGERLCRIIPEFMYDPSPEQILSSLVPEYIYTTIYGVLLEATASETGARMTAMKNASDNAEDMIKDLNLKYHRERQQQITMEIAEIVSGAVALGS